MNDTGSPAEEGLINEGPPPVEVAGANPDLHLFAEGGHLYQECCTSKLPDASFLSPDEVVVAENEYADPARCPDFLINTQPLLGGELFVNRSIAAKDHVKRHDRVCHKYDTTVIDIRNPKQQAAVNKDLRDAARSHAEVWQWMKGGLEKHLSSMSDKVLKEFISIMHSASLQSSVRCYRETTDDEVILSTT